jgi:hypothetical protein
LLALSSAQAAARPALSAEEPATLEYFTRDYVDHLKHHLRQGLPIE